ncbi:uncharacterized protein LOC109835584 [Asparagus officinalis]|uniref:uncharacterized protein LOC109835584 n=1 Tax=Asparagus officinalis TaxID=4686 RepID=UPI00098E638C|nr:uncharacterized protein LOC109835584 [Asparagus officinalis]
MWDPNILDIQIVKLSAQHITCIVKSLDGRIDCVISSIYGYNLMENRKDLWSELKLIHQSIGNTPWLLCGDFNVVIGNEEKLGGSLLSEANTKDFKDFIDGYHLNHLKLIGCFIHGIIRRIMFSRVWSRLDRALVNDSWINIFSSSQVEFLLPHFSNHSPALVSIYEEFYSKLKKLRGALKEINRKHFYNISEQAQRARHALEDAQKNLQTSPFNPVFINKEKECVAAYNKLLDCEMSFYQQKARIAWSIKGDRCTILFHSIIKSNRHHNKVLVLYNGMGQRITNGDEIANELISLYKNLMGTATDTLNPDKNIIQSGPCMNNSQARILSALVSKDEVRNTIFSMSDNKALGPDGYGVSFFKSA